MILYFALTFHLLGVKFDEEAENPEEYDGDYPLLSYGVISIFGSMRSAYGDIQVPLYGFWTETYADESNEYAKLSGFYIALIWLYFYVEVFLMVIMGLNFLVGIVSASYERIMVGQANAVLEGMNDLNREYCIEQDPKSDEDIDFLVMAKAIDAVEEADMSGVVGSIKEELHSIKD